MGAQVAASTRGPPSARRPTSTARRGCREFHISRNPTPPAQGTVWVQYQWSLREALPFGRGHQQPDALHDRAQIVVLPATTAVWCVLHSAWGQNDVQVRRWADLTHLPTEHAQCQQPPIYASLLLLPGSAIGRRLMSGLRKK